MPATSDILKKTLYILLLSAKLMISPHIFIKVGFSPNYLQPFPLISKFPVLSIFFFKNITIIFLWDDWPDREYSLSGAIQFSVSVILYVSGNPV